MKRKKSWEDMTAKEKYNEVVNEVFSGWFVNQMDKVEETFSEKDVNDVKKILMEMSKFSDIVSDPETGLLNIQVMKNAIARGLVACFVGQEDFRLSGR